MHIKNRLQSGQVETQLTSSSYRHGFLQFYSRATPDNVVFFIRVSNHFEFQPSHCAYSRTSLYGISIAQLCYYYLNSKNDSIFLRAYVWLAR